MSIWKDTTSYSRGERGRIEPTCFTAKSGRLSITVTCGHIYFKGQWVMHCFQLGIDTKPLSGCATLANAKATAIRFVKDRIALLTRDIEVIEQSE